MSEPAFRLVGIHVYPLKSGAGFSVGTRRVEHEGLAGDRRMMVVDGEGNCQTARSVPKLLQVQAHLDGDEVVLAAPSMPALVFARSSLSRVDAVSIWGDDVSALDAGDAAAGWLTRFLGRPCRLVVKGAMTRRPLGIGTVSFAETAGAGGTVSFADTAPLLLTNMVSLAHLNRHLDHEAEMARFRPSLVVAGPPAYDEDGWRIVRIGEVVFEVAGACDRCVMVTLDPESGDARPDHEPLAMLSRQRRGEDGRPYFGQFLIPRAAGRLSIGDAVEVLARKPAITIMPGTAKPVSRLPSAAGGGVTISRSRERLVRCVAVIDEADDFRTFRFEAGEPIIYRPGQFITLLLEIDGETVRRNYTLSSTPSRPHHISVTVKRTGGRASSWLHEKLKVGDSVRMLGPNGRFHLAAAGEAERLLMLSAGSGITPIIAMLRFIADANLPTDVAFHHSARNRGDISFVDELLLIERQMGGRLRLSWNLTGAGQAADFREVLRRRMGHDRFNVFQGRLDGPMLRNACPDLADRTVFCCGPDGFRRLARTVFEEWRPVPKLPFLEESFGPDPARAMHDEIGAYAVTFANSGVTASGEGATTLLELARRVGVALPADCEAGICGTCRCRIASGDWRIAANAADLERAALSDAEKEAGYVLACSTSPIGEVTVEL